MSSSKLFLYFARDAWASRSSAACCSTLATRCLLMATCGFKHTYTRMYVCVYICTCRVHTCIHTCTRIYVYMYILMATCEFKPYMHTDDQCPSSVSFIGLAGTMYIRCMYVRHFWQGIHQIHGHFRCEYTVLANPTHVSLGKNIHAHR
jgi:hypothetical protein